ncbi:MAG TPA: TIM barrel protein [Candidatus Didemnitutus sp.]|nr:TIM barrel protein [Candidatus Didemnitutus sp.]
MPYRRAVSTLGCPDLTLAEALALAQRHRIDAVELRALAGTLDLPDYFARTYGAPAELAEKLRGEAPRLVALDTSLKLVGNTTGDREKFLAFVPWAEALGIPQLRVFDGGEKFDAAELAAAKDTVQWWRELRSKNRWRTDIAVETHDTLFTTDSITRFLAAVPGTRILWDTHHTWKRGGEDPVATWRAIRPHVAHIHVKDSVSRPSARHPFTYVLPGDGEFPMTALKTALRAEYTGAVSLEWERQWHPYLEPLDAALTAAAGRDWW